ncbi:MAG: type II toxin-antitoxin system VapC family toxin [Deltaproteobacteria bacterium]|nr:type II toxin-antitoxin system VapC family toxin [Deltaproteobacteria bacterium]
MILLDTNVISELMRASPSPRVAAWVGHRPAASLYTTAITQAEILHGIALLPAGRRRAAIEDAAAAVFEHDFSGRVLPFGGDAARGYARVAGERARLGRPISHFDAQIAGIATAVGAMLATRNTRDFELCGLSVVDPWG